VFRILFFKVPSEEMANYPVRYQVYFVFVQNDKHCAVKDILGINSFIKAVRQTSVYTRTGTCIPYRQCLLFKHDIIFYLENKYNFGAKIFLYYK
jgi:hypothetical protein